jgi:hypothetical protein
MPVHSGCPTNLRASIVRIVAALTLHQATGSPLAEEALRRIGDLYTIEAEIPRPPGR